MRRLITAVLPLMVCLGGLGYPEQQQRPEEGNEAEAQTDEGQAEQREGQPEDGEETRATGMKKFRAALIPLEVIGGRRNVPKGSGIA